MSTAQKIFIGVLILVVIAVIIIVVNYYSKKAPDVSTTTSTSQTSGLSGVGGLGGIGSLFAQLSDERFKANINKINNSEYRSAYEDIKSIPIYTYMYRDASGMQPCNKGCKIDGVKRLGFIAQDIEKVNPNFITKDSNGIRYVDMMQMIALNTAALKNMQQKIEYQQQMLNSNPQYGGRATFP